MNLPWSALAYFSSVGDPDYQGTYDASTAAYPGYGSAGHYYKVTTAGTISGTSYAYGEYFGYDGSNWAKIPVDKLGIDVTEDGKVLTTKYDETTDTPPATVKVMIHGNGTVGGSTITDRSASPHTPVATNAVLSDTVKRFGNSSIYFNGTNAYVTIPNNAAFDTAALDFNKELIVYMTANSGTRYLMGQESADASDKGWKLFFDATDGICFSYATQAGDWTDEITYPWSPSINTFYHISVVRCTEGSTDYIRIFINGTLMISYDCTGDTFNACSEDIWIGASPVSGGSDFFAGYIEEIRYTVNECWWSTEFIPDDSPYYTIVGYQESAYDMDDYAIGAASSVDNTLPRFDGTGGKTLQTSGVVVDDSNILTAAGLKATGFTASELVATDGSKNLQSLAVATYPSLTELSYVKGVTSAVQTQLGTKMDKIVSTDNAVPRFDGIAGVVQNSGVTVDDSNILTAAGLKATGFTASELVATDGSKNLQSLAVATYPSLTELSYVKGVTSAIQTQINGKVTAITSTDNALARYDGTSGALQDTGVIIDDSDNVGIGVTPTSRLHVQSDNSVGAVNINSVGSSATSGTSVAIQADATAGTPVTQVAMAGYATGGTSDNYCFYGGSGDIYGAGDLDIGGTASAGVKAFKIDHPLDPENKFLQHIAIESPEMRTSYYGQAQLVDGKATITLPNWWHPLNGNNKSEYNYQLTCIGGYTETWISSEIEDGSFEISGNSDIKVSWTVSAIRHDVYAENNRIEVEVDKEDPVISERKKTEIVDGEEFEVTYDEVQNRHSAKGFYRQAVTPEQTTKNKTARVEKSRAKKEKITALESA